LDSLISRKIVLDENKIIIDVVNPEIENPEIVNTVVGAGGHIQYVLN